MNDRDAGHEAAQHGREAGHGTDETDDSTKGLGGLFEDLEQQASGMHLAERDAELADRARGEYAAVSFASRVHASVGLTVALGLVGGQFVEGRLTQAGSDWCMVRPGGQQGPWLVRLAAVATASGMSSRAVPAEARPALARLSFGSALHRLAQDYQELVVLLEPSAGLRVRLLRIGADFIEVQPLTAAAGPATVLLSFAAVKAVRPG
jgi:hypothetical protein